MHVVTLNDRLQRNISNYILNVNRINSVIRTNTVWNASPAKTVSKLIETRVQIRTDYKYASTNTNKSI